MSSIVAILKGILEAAGLLKQLWAFYKGLKKKKLKSDAQKTFKALNEAKTSKERMRTAKDINSLISRM